MRRGPGRPYVRTMTRPHDASPPAAQQKLGRLRTKWAALGAAVAVTLGGAGIGGLGIVSAEVSSGDRPVFVPITPCRLVDTRPAPLNTGVQPAPLGPTDTYVIQVRGNTDPCPATIPSDAVGLAMNVTALRATQQTFLTFWGDGANPGTANLNPSPGQPPTPNSVNTPLGSNGSFQMYNDAGTVEVVIDVNGYYVGHNHDDRYVTKTDAALAAPVMSSRADTAMCNFGATGNGDPLDGIFLDCFEGSPFMAGIGPSHNLMINATISWYNAGATSYGECRLEHDDVPIPGTEITMGELADTTGSARNHQSSMTAVVGPVSGVSSVTVACTERVESIVWLDPQISVIAIPV
jgi:hypothetical protein